MDNSIEVVENPAEGLSLEEKVGITEYLCPGLNGFNGILKQR